MAGSCPEIILSDTAGEMLEVDVLAYPEDTYLIVDPYTSVQRTGGSMAELVAGAEASLPRPLGEILELRSAAVAAAWLFRLVVLDFEQPRPCRPQTVAKTLQRLVWQGGRLKARRLGLDRFELLEPCISAHRVLTSLYREMQRLKRAGGLPPEALVFSLQPGATRRHYQMALENLACG